jgi:hypothetical protein
MLEKILFLLYKNDLDYDLRIAGEKIGWRKDYMILDIEALKLFIGIQNNGKRLSYYFGKHGKMRKTIPKKELLDYLILEIKKYKNNPQFDSNL